MPPIALRLALTAPWPWRNSVRYIAMSPSEIVCRTVETAIHAYAP
jgi:hypothetical protein